MPTQNIVNDKCLYLQRRLKMEHLQGDEVTMINRMTEGAENDISLVLKELIN